MFINPIWLVKFRLKYLFLLLSLFFILTGCGDNASIEILEINNSAENKNSVIVVGKITPRDGMLSISYSGECGKSYYHDIQTLDGVFTQAVETMFIHDVDLFLSTSSGGEVSKGIHFGSSENGQKKHGRECDYLKLERGYESDPLVYVIEESCYEIGVKYGSCISRQHLNIVCKTGTDVSIPFRCRDRLDTKEGIEAGRI